MSKENKKNFSNYESNDELDLKSIFRMLIRQKKIIFIVNSLSLFIATIYVYTVKPIWQGSFEIVVSENKKRESYDNFNLTNFLLNIATQMKQKYILKSESVLMPVFNFKE